MHENRPLFLIDLSSASAQAFDRLSSAGVNVTLASNESPTSTGPVLISTIGTFHGLEGVNRYMAQTNAKPPEKT